MPRKPKISADGADHSQMPGDVRSLDLAKGLAFSGRGSRRDSSAGTVLLHKSGLDQAAAMQ
jgi:hypothetical protein